MLLIDPAARADQPHAPRPRAAGHPEGMTAARRLPAPGAARGARSHAQTPYLPCSPPPDYRIAAGSVKDACGAGSAGQATPGP